MVTFRGHLNSILVVSILMIPLMTAFGYEVAPNASAQISCNQLYEDGIVDASTVEEFQMLDDGRTNVESDEYGDNEDDWQFYNDPVTGLNWHELCPLGIHSALHSNSTTILLSGFESIW